MSEPKNVDKICPFFPPIPTKKPINIPAGPYGHLIEVTFTLTSCQKERCQLWGNGLKACCLELIPAHLNDLFTFAATIEGCLDNIETAIRDLKEEKNGNS